MSSYSRQIMNISDEDLAEMMSGPMPGSTNHELIKFEMQRRAMTAQRDAANATLRGAIAAERYTRATWILISVTAVGLLVSVLK